MPKLAPMLLLTSAAILLSGCGSSQRRTEAPPAMTPKPTAPRDGLEPSAPQPVRVVRERVRMNLRGRGAGLLSPTRLAFHRSGSSSCMPTPTTLSVSGASSLRIWLKDGWPKNRLCLADLVVEPVVIAISPKEIDVHRWLTVRLYYPRTKHAAVFRAAPLS